MGQSNWTAAMIVLAVFVVFGAAGAAALNASFDQSKSTYSDATGGDTPGVLSMGEDLTGTLAYLMPLFGFVAVPLGIVGLLGLAIVRRSRRSTFAR